MKSWAILACAVLTSQAAAAALRCPAAYLGVVLVVNGPSGSSQTGIRVALTGAVATAMTCRPNQGATLCTWPAGSDVVAGQYTLQVSAPAFKTATTTARITISSNTNGGCVQATFSPGVITLEAA
jgi:hypothetical protein